MAGVRTDERDAVRRLPDPAAGRRTGPLRLPGRRTLLLLAGALLAAGAFGGWALYFSDWLRIEKVSVGWPEGARELTDDQVLAAAAVPLGAPMASLDKDAVSARLRGELPRVKSVQVVRAWPHGVGLKVIERQPEVLLPAGSGYTEVDEEGVAFAEVVEPVAGVPVLRLELEHNASLRRFGEDRIRQEAVKVAAALPEPVHRRTRAIRVGSYDSLTLELTGGRTVLWGSGEEAAAKAAALTAVLKAVPEADHFDVSVPSAPAASGG
ncbi:cell division protein FtsQ [Streptomyces sodiiphilus]|uniref:Cell division protein FtsQ n=1 Tax=Streptomyces sodiiphilus TaxID=226217 RepID=A0ABP5AQU7_9ACTN